MSEVIAKFRASNPQYENLSDAQLADAMYQKFYATRMSRADYDAKLGLAPAAPQSVAEGTPEVRSIFTDTALKSKDPQALREAAMRSLSGGFGAGTSDAQLQDMVLERFPDATFRNVEDGVVATIQGKDYWLNKPGISGQDADNVRTNLAMGGVLSPLGMGGGGMLARFLTGGLVAGGTEAAMDVAAMTEGSKQGVDWTRAGVAGAVGGAVDAIAPYIVKGIARWIKGGRQVVQGGQLSPEVQKLLKINNIDPSTVSPATMSKFEQIVKATDPDDLMAAFRQAEAQSLPGSPNLMTQQATQAGDDLRLMQEARQGLLGRGSEITAQGGTAMQGQALQGTVEQMQRNLGGQGLPPGAGAKQAQAALVEEKNILKGQVDALYEAARNSTGAAAVPKDDLGVFHKDLVRALDDAGFDFEEMPRLTKYLGQLDAADGSIKGLEKLRSRLTQASSGLASTDPSQALALRKVKEGLDSFLSDMATQGKVTGDPDVLDLWKQAIGKRADLGAKFQDKDLVSALVETTGRDARLKVSPDDAANTILGSGLGRKDMAINLGKIRQLLGSGSDAWNGLKEEAFLRLFKGQPQGEGVAALATGRFKPGDYNGRLAKFLTDTPEAAAQLFSKEEIAQMQQLGRVLDMVYGLRPIPQNVNPSGTAGFLAGMFKRVTGNLGFLGSAARGTLGKLLSPVSNAASQKVIEKMVQGILPSTMPKTVLSPLVPALNQSRE